MENNRMNDARMSKIIRLENEIGRINDQLNILRKDIYYSKINSDLCKGHVHYSYTYKEDNFLEKNFKMKGKYVPSFLALINCGNQYYEREYFIMPPEEYTYHLHNEDDYLVSLDYYGYVCTYINLFNLSKDRLNRKKEEKGLFDYDE